MDTYKRIIKVLNETLNIDNADINAEVGEPYQWDSLKHLKVILNIEKEFNVNIGAMRITELTSAKKIYEFLTFENVKANVD
ncbi:MAG: acyl carrier protein [Bdellovibrionales bacterium]|nr:acyl carrier protein [Bdellovibrionales bacterium]